MTVTAEKLINIFCKIHVFSKELMQMYLNKFSTSESSFYSGYVESSEMNCVCAFVCTYLCMLHRQVSV